MWRALALATLVSACMPSLPVYTPITGTPGMAAEGDFDGDGRTDTAAFQEDREGALILVVRRAIAPRTTIELWGGDISSVPFFTVRTASPGRYATNCEAHGGCGDGLPSEVTLAHDGLIVHGSADGSDLLYYWDGAAFRNIVPDLRR